MKEERRERKRREKEEREMESEDYSAAEDADPYRSNKGRCDRKRRFSEAQIKSLESIFESQSKLEPRKKLQLARELGLQPRQVAIWFQNKRARWKSKQLEREYAELRADYDSLLSSFESLKKEKQLLVKQLQKLAGLLKRPTDGSSNDGDSDSGKGTEDRGDTRPGLLFAELGSDPRVVMYSGDEEIKRMKYVGQDEDDLLYLREPVSSGGGYLDSADRRCCLNGSCSPDKCCSTSPQWWESWPLTE